MKTRCVIGENKNGDAVLFSGVLVDCISWIWNNCDVGDLECTADGGWRGFAYYDALGDTFAIEVDRYYRLED